MKTRKDPSKPMLVALNAKIINNLNEVNEAIKKQIGVDLSRPQLISMLALFYLNNVDKTQEQVK
jgi:hypothetical protein